MTEEPILLDVVQAQTVADQLRETASHRGWWILALAVMPNHVHVLIRAPADVLAEKVMGDLKSWATRRLKVGSLGRKRWWTQNGSTRPKDTPEAIRSATIYVRDQPAALTVWLDPRIVARLAEIEVEYLPPSGTA
jgi:REP element-mobilizing transposase RayT